MDLTVCKDNINAFVVFKIWSCDYIKAKFIVRVRFVSQTDFGILFPTMHVVRWTFLEIHSVPLTCGLLVSCLLLWNDQIFMFFQLNLGKKKPSGKCVSFNRRLSVKGERSGIYSCFLSLDVTRLSNGACFPSNVAFLRGSWGRSWSPELEAMVLFCCYVFGFGGNWKLYLPLWPLIEVSSMLSCAKGQAENGRSILPSRAAGALQGPVCMGTLMCPFILFSPRGQNGKVTLWPEVDLRWPRTKDWP